MRNGGEITRAFDRLVRYQYKSDARASGFQAMQNDYSLARWVLLHVLP